MILPEMVVSSPPQSIGGFGPNHVEICVPAIATVEGEVAGSSCPCNQGVTSSIASTSVACPGSKCGDDVIDGRDHSLPLCRRSLIEVPRGVEPSRAVAEKSEVAAPLQPRDNDFVLLSPFLMRKRSFRLALA